MSEVIRVENLSKAYQLGQFTTGTLSRDLERWWAITRGKEDPFLKIGENNDRSTKGKSDIVWSLKDINFSINQGDTVGIIGKNGAGKSTLLKVLSQVTGPTTGSIKVKGRIASLLEVGTGFHPELTGKENIFLNGAILGMRKKEILRKFEEIVDFSGIERYIDTPVKRYSSGMYVRLAFAVAAHLESEILIVDEVLAVGDAEFQKKCLGKMSDVSTSEGRTVLFVSHNMAAMKQLCRKGILLENGLIKANTEIKKVIRIYNEDVSFSDSRSFVNEKPQATDILSVDIINNNETLYTEDNFFLRINFILSRDYNNCIINFIISNYDQDLLMSFDTDSNQIGPELKYAGNYEACIEIPAYKLKPGKYKLSSGIGIVSSDAICQHADIIQFEISSRSNIYTFISYRSDRIGILPLMVDWKIKKNT